MGFCCGSSKTVLLRHMTAATAATTLACLFIGMLEQSQKPREKDALYQKVFTYGLTTVSLIC